MIVTGIYESCRFYVKVIAINQLICFINCRFFALKFYHVFIEGGLGKKKFLVS